MICAKCDARLYAGNKSGLCRVHALAATNSNPEIRAKMAATHRRLRENPAYVEKHRAAVQKAVRSLGPSHIEKLRANGRKSILQSPDVKAKAHSAECRAVRIVAREETMLGWCPPAMRDEYRRLVRFKRMTAVEARAIIEADIPGTVEYVRRHIANANDARAIMQERSAIDPIALSCG